MRVAEDGPNLNQMDVREKTVNDEALMVGADFFYVAKKATLHFLA